VVEARNFFGRPPARLRAPKLVPLPTGEAERLFLERFRHLTV
jgi:hypothetical protein